MKLLVKGLVIVIVINLLGAIGFAGYSVMTGKFDAEHRSQYLAIFNGEKLVPYVEADNSGEDEAEQEQAVERIEEIEIQGKKVSRDVQELLQMIRQREFSLELAKLAFKDERDRLQEKKKKFEDEMVVESEKAKEKGFQVALQRYSIMKASMVKDDFMTMDDEQVVRYISAMPAKTAKGILERFRSPEEKSKRQRVMKVLESKKVFDKS